MQKHTCSKVQYATSQKFELSKMEGKYYDHTYCIQEVSATNNDFKYQILKKKTKWLPAFR